VLRDHQLHSNFNKCDLFQKEIQYLGHTILAEGVKVDPEKLKEIMDWPAPRNVTKVRSFLGLDIYYRRFINLFYNIIHPITSLQRKGKKFLCPAECKAKFK